MLVDLSPAKKKFSLDSFKAPNPLEIALQASGQAGQKLAAQRRPAAAGPTWGYVLKEALEGGMTGGTVAAAAGSDFSNPFKDMSLPGFSDLMKYFEI